MKAGTQEYFQQYYKANKEKHTENMKRYKEDNVIKLKEYDKEYHAAAYQRSKTKHGEGLKIKWNKQKKALNEKRRNIVIDIKSKGCCEKCREKRIYILDFHHIDPSQKLFDLGNCSNYSIIKILEEIKKCKLLCRNCHGEFHYLEKTTGIDILQYLELE